MKRKKSFVVLGMVLLACFLVLHCAEDEKKDSETENPIYNDTNPPGTGENYPNQAQNFCNDQVDDPEECDNYVDRFGVPPHCSVSEPVQTTSNGSKYRLVATGHYSDSAKDTLTCEITTGGGSGVAQLQCTSKIGHTGPGISAPVVITNGVQIDIGNFGLVIYFVDNLQGDFQLNVGEKWVFTAQSVENCMSRPDPSCYHPDAASEAMCENGIDDDADGDIDADDVNCSLHCRQLYGDTTGANPLSSVGYVEAYQLDFGTQTIHIYELEIIGNYVPYLDSESLIWFPECSNEFDDDADDGIDMGLDIGFNEDYEEFGDIEYEPDSECISPCDMDEEL